MSRQWPTRFWPALLACMLGLFYLAGVPGLRAAGAQEVDETPTPPSIDSLNSCISQNNRLDVLALLDDSDSLGDNGRGGNDPEGARFVGLRGAVAALVDGLEVQAGGEQSEVAVGVATFTDSFRQAGTDRGDGGWFRLGEDDDALAGVIDEVDDDRTSHGTDYGAALEGATRVLSDRAAAATRDGGRPPCQALIWFTDGENQPSGQSAAEAFQEICGPEGPAEALHRERVHIFTVALANSSDFTPAGADALEAITDGDGGSRRCGSAATSELGLLTLAEDTDRLLLLLSTIFQPASRHTSSGVFLTDETVGGFQIVLSRLDTGNSVRLVSPGGSAVELSPESDASEIGGARLTERWLTPTVARVHVDQLDRASSGEWRLEFDVPEDVEPPWNLSLEPALFPSLGEPPIFIRGEESTVVVQAVDREGRAASAPAGARLRSVIVDRVTDQAEPLSLDGPDASGAWRGQYRLSESSSTSRLGVQTQLLLPDVGGEAVPTKPVVTFVPVGLPPGFPVVTPPALDALASITGEGVADGVLTISADGGPGCVWLDGSDIVQLPGDAEGVDVTVESPSGASSGSCVSVDADDPQGELRVRFRNEHEADGRVAGVLHLVARDDDTGATLPIDVPFEFTLARDIDPTRLWVALLILIGFGVALPIAVLYGMNRWNARFEDPQLVRRWSGDVRLSNRGELTDAQGGPLALAFSDFSPLNVAGRTTRLGAGEHVRLDAVATGSVFRSPRTFRLLDFLQGPHGEATGSKDTPVTAGAPTNADRSWRGGNLHEVPLALPGTWVFARTRVEYVGQERRAGKSDVDLAPTRSGSEARIEALLGELTLFVAARTTSSGVDEVVTRARKQLRERLPDLMAGAKPPGPADDRVTRRERLRGWFDDRRPHRRTKSPKPSTNYAKGSCSGPRDDLSIEQED